MEATLQVIMEQLKELDAGQGALKSEISTTTAELKSDICAEVKSGMSKITAYLVTPVCALENKMGKCTRVIRSLRDA